MNESNIDNELKSRNVKEVKYVPVKAFGSAGHVILPKNWIGKYVQVILLKDQP